MSPVTRFRPTAGNGPLHLGHLLNAYYALLYANKCGGRFLAILDPMFLGGVTEFPEDKAWPIYRANWALIGRLFPNRQRINTALNSDFALKLLSDELGEEISGFVDTYMRAAAFDFLMDVNIIFRGRDWDPHSPFGLTDEIAYAYVHKHYMENWSCSPLEIRYTPLLVDKSRQKLSKRKKDFSISISAAEGEGIALLSLFAYVVGLFTGEMELTLTELGQAHEKLDFENETRECFIHEPEVLREVDRHIKHRVADAFPNEDLADALTVVYEEILSPKDDKAFLSGH